MPLFSLPDECFINIFSFLDNESLYKCLFVNRYYCRLSIPIVWRDPFTETNGNNSISLISTLLSCFNEDEISSLIPCAIDSTNFNNQLPLFEYGNFVRKIDHGYCIDHVVTWLYLSSKIVPYIHKYQDCRVQKLVDAIYHMIMRKGSNLQEFVIYSSQDCHYFDLPKFSIFTTYEHGIKNLRFLGVNNNINNVKYQNTSEFLSMVSKFCDGIVNCELWTSFFDSEFANQILDIIKLQPLKRILLCGEHVNIKNILYTLKEFRSETLKELLFEEISFQQTDLSFISKLECLERLEFVNCTGFTFKKKLYLKELKLWNSDMHDDNNNAVSIINFLCSETLIKLSLNIITAETVKAVKETCQNISILCIKSSGQDLLIPLICELSSLRTLDIKLSGVSESPLIKLLSNHLISIEHLLLDFCISLKNFEYFVNNCKVKLKRLGISISTYGNTSRKNYLVHVNNFQKVHNSLKILEIGYYKYDKFNWTDEEIETVNLLKNQGIDIVSSNYTNISNLV